MSDPTTGTPQRPKPRPYLTKDERIEWLEAELRQVEEELARWENARGSNSAELLDRAEKAEAELRQVEESNAELERAIKHWRKLYRDVLLLAAGTKEPQ